MYWLTLESDTKSREAVGELSDPTRYRSVAVGLSRSCELGEAHLQVGRRLSERIWRVSRRTVSWVLELDVRFESGTDARQVAGMDICQERRKANFGVSAATFGDGYRAVFRFHTDDVNWHGTGE